MNLVVVCSDVEDADESRAGLLRGEGKKGWREERQMGGTEGSLNPFSPCILAAEGHDSSAYDI